MKENLAQLIEKDIVISYDPEIIERDKELKCKFDTILLRSGGEIKTINEIKSQSLIDYYSKLRVYLKNCCVLLLVLPQSPRRYKQHFEIVFDCAFFREILIYLYIPPKMFNPKSGERREVRRRIEVQKTKWRRNIYLYKDLNDLAKLLDEHINDFWVGHNPPQQSNIVSESLRNQVFISYSHKDKEWLERIQIMLNPLIRKDKITVWDDTKIKPGTRWKEEIKKALDSAKVAVLLVSPDFLASDFVDEYELTPLLEAAEKEGLTILWVAISCSMYTETAIKHYHAVNDPSEPLAKQQPPEQNQTILNICKEIKRRLVEP